MNRSPGTPTVSVHDDADVAAEVGQRSAAAAHAAQQVINTWMLTQQRDQDRQRYLDKANRDSDRGGFPDESQRRAAHAALVKEDQAALEAPAQAPPDAAQSVPVGGHEPDPEQELAPSQGGRQGLHLVTAEQFVEVADPSEVARKMTELDPDRALSAGEIGHHMQAGLARQDDYLNPKMSGREEYLAHTPHGESALGVDGGREAEGARSR